MASQDAPGAGKVWFSMDTVETVNALIMALFFLCYAYQFFYVAVALVRRPRPLPQAVRAAPCGADRRAQ